MNLHLACLFQKLKQFTVCITKLTFDKNYDLYVKNRIFELAQFFFYSHWPAGECQSCTLNLASVFCISCIITFLRGEHINCDRTIVA